jgi:hypothetical protein
MHRVFAALGAGVLNGHPLASACCIRGMVTIVTATSPSNANAAIIAITANVVFNFLSYC